MNSQVATGLGEYHLGHWQIKVQLGSVADPDIVRVKQEHDARIVPSNEPGPADGIYTGQAGPPVGMSTADCMPLVVVTTDSALVLHVSRKTLIAGQLEQVPTIIDTTAIAGVFIGPHICSDHFIFEHAGPAITAFMQRWPAAVQQVPTGVALSLDQVVASYLEEWKIPPAKTMRVGVCTVERPELPSYCRSLQAKQKLTDHIITSVRYVEKKT